MTNKQWGASAVTNPDYIAEQNEKTKELRLMLEQAQKQEPVGYAEKLIEALYENGDPVSVEAAEFLEQAQKQEPVGFMCQGCFYELDDVDKYCEMEHIYLYTHPSPPQRQPLTDEIPKGVLLAISNAGLTLIKTQHGYELRKLGTIEAAHGIKGKA